MINNNQNISLMRLRVLPFVRVPTTLHGLPLHYFGIGILENPPRHPRPPPAAEWWNGRICGRCVTYLCISSISLIIIRRPRFIISWLRACRN